MAQASQPKTPFDPLGADSVRALCRLLNPDDDDDGEFNSVPASRAHMSPADLRGREHKPTAKPNVKVEAKMRKSSGINANENSAPLNERVSASSVKDCRQLPDYEILHQQTVGPEDIFLGITGKDPTSDHCDKFIIKVKLPDTELKAIQLKVSKKIDLRVSLCVAAFVYGPLTSLVPIIN
ncbi:hypothetical protein BESB_005830 [Besnoitia besnoiti]|uniref:Sarcoma antigen NY-SAR-97 n=1 Tax=Besnoitia besnoiti TaxID=94643 RepID=A0A2A9MQG1_BESBE|nr:hypothetical protein BESB_005830 [Besnoitia besnoiti]PFH38242.1 hypothetical protein BESB_005830 [Besnoitia besnoiti]